MYDSLVSKYLTIIAMCLSFSLLSPAAANELHKAARNGDLEAVNLLIESVTDLNATDGEGETALHKAAKANKAEIITRLLDVGADPLISGMGPFGATDQRICADIQKSGDNLSLVCLCGFMERCFPFAIGCIQV
ncbi:MAG: ankyrin repeat domain-containing protein, partial [Pseudomonadota bacterium]